MTHDDPEGLAELARRRYGMDLSEPHESDEVEDVSEVAPEPEPWLEPEPIAEAEPAAEPEAEAEAAPDDRTAVESTATEPVAEVEPEAQLTIGDAILVEDLDADGGTDAPDFEVFEGPDPYLVREHAIDLRLARLHLRTGAIPLARAELEALAVLQALDRDGYLDLAETRWRSGELASAGDAVVEYLEGGGTDALAYVIAAEASAAMGRIGDARRLARRALDRLNVPLERVFAGQPRSEVWPSATDAEVQPVSTLFSGAPPSPSRGGRIGLSGAPALSSGHARPLESLLATGQMDPWDSSPPPGAGGGSPYETLPLGLDLDRVDAPLPVSPPQQPGVPSEFDPAAELQAAREAIASGDLDRAGVRLALVLRVRPALAPAVLDVARGVDGPAFDLVRGDALRLTGHEAAAQEAFASAVRGVEEGASSAGNDPGHIALFELTVEPEPQQTVHLGWAVEDAGRRSEAAPAPPPTSATLTPATTEPTPWDAPRLISPVAAPAEDSEDDDAAEPADAADSAEPADLDATGAAAPDSGAPASADDGIEAAARDWPSRARGPRPEDPIRRHRPGPIRRSPPARPTHHRHHDDPRAE